MTIHLLSYAGPGLSFPEKITPCFSPLKSYIPWGGTFPQFTDSRITTYFPPEELKPEADFNLILDECFNWASEQGEKSRREIIKTGHMLPVSSESLRHIKTVISNRLTDTSEKDRVIRWHMLLLLADRIEANRADANELLEGLKKSPSPLLNNADLTENTKYPLETLTGIDPDSFLTDTNIMRLLQAWYGLFGSLIPDSEPLLITDRRIYEYLLDECEGMESSLENREAITFKCPVFEDNTQRDDYAGNNICDILMSDKSWQDKLTEINAVSDDFQKKYQSEISAGYILYSIFLFQTPVKPEAGSFFKFISGRPLVFAELNG